MPEKVKWLRAKAARALPGDADAPPAWDAPQFLYELVTKDDGEALLASLSSLSSPGGAELIVALLPVVALADVREAIDREPANRIYQLLASPGAFLAWMQLPQQLRVPGSRATFLDACVVAAHCIDLQRDAFAYLGVSELVPAARAAAAREASAASNRALIAAANDLEAKAAHSRESRAAEEDAAVAAAAAGAAERPARRPRAAESTSDAQLEEFAVGFRTSPVLPTRDDILIVAPGGDAGAPALLDAPGGGGPGAAQYLSAPPLPHNRARGAFPSLNAFVAMHFRLLREDALAALRAGLLEAVERRARPSGSCRVYTGVRFVGVHWGRVHVGWRVRFARPGGRRGGGAISARVLLTGSLLGLVPEGDAHLENIVFATVASRDTRLLDDPRGPFIDIEQVVDDARTLHAAAPGAADDGDDGLFAIGAAAVGPAAPIRPAFDEAATYTMFESSVR